MQSSTPQLLALVVSIGAYRHVRALKGPANDAKAVAGYLAGFTNFSVDVQLLTDEQASQSAITDGFLTYLSQDDFDKINQLFDDMYDQMNDNVGRIYRPLGKALRFIDNQLKDIERSIMKRNRALAQKNCQALHTATELQRGLPLRSLEERARKSDLLITRPPFPLGLSLEPVVRAEVGTPAQKKIDVVLRTRLLPEIQK